MIPSKDCIDLIKQFEGFFTKAYLCPAGVVTIGFGSTMWMDNKKIKMGEIISMAGAEKLLSWELTKKSSALIGLNLSQQQFDACLSLIYNIGVGNFNRSTLLKKIKANPNDETIADEFKKWNKAKVDGELIVLKGLTRRRDAEQQLYFKSN
jgi:lysozyme